MDTGLRRYDESLVQQQEETYVSRSGSRRINKDQE
jgi:hypothetical protein